VTTDDNYIIKVLLDHFYHNSYKYNSYHRSTVMSTHAQKLIEMGLLKGHAIQKIQNGDLRGYIGITELGKTWLEFNEL